MLSRVAGSLGGLYASVYWCLFPQSAQEKVIPRLQDCQDSLQDRYFKLKQREQELHDEINVVKKHRDRTRLRRVFLELKSSLKDIAVTENTLWTVDRQLQLFERSDLNSLIIDTLQSSTAALNGMSKNLPGIENVDESTETLQSSMQEVNEMTETVSSALQRRLDDDYSTLEKELDDFLNDELDKQVPLVDDAAQKAIDHDTAQAKQGRDTHAPHESRADSTPAPANHMQPEGMEWDTTASLGPPPFPRASRIPKTAQDLSDGVHVDSPLLAAM